MKAPTSKGLSVPQLAHEYTIAMLFATIVGIAFMVLVVHARPLPCPQARVELVR